MYNAEVDPFAEHTFPFVSHCYILLRFLSFVFWVQSAKVLSIEYSPPHGGVAGLLGCTRGGSRDAPNSSFAPCSANSLQLQHFIQQLFSASLSSSFIKIWHFWLPKNSETAQKGQKAVICSLNLQLRPLQSDSSCPIFAAKLQKLMQIHLKTLAIYANIFENVRNLCK